MAQVKPIERLSRRLAAMLLIATSTVGSAARIPVQGESRGTAIFFQWLNGRFVVATDSIEFHDKKPPTFDDCKIVKQGVVNDFFTISGGVRSADIIQPNQSALHWDTQATAANAYAAVKGPRDPGRVAEEWRHLILLQLQSLPPKMRYAWEWMVRYNMMLFVGLRADGSIDARVAAFHLEGKRFSIDLSQPPMNKIRSIAEGGNAAKVFLSGETPEAQKEATARKESLKSKLGVKTQEEYQGQLVMKVVDWAIKHPGVDKIGGVVEAVELQPHSTIVWLRPCPVDGKRSSH